MANCIHNRAELDACTPGARFAQHFRYALITKSYGSDAVTMDLVDQGVLTDLDIKLIYFLYSTKVADADQLLERFPEYGNKEHLNDTLEFLTKKRMINYFVYVAPGEELMPADAYRIYMFDFVGIQLLAHFYPSSEIWNWSARSVKEPPEIIKRGLLMTDFRIALETKLATPLIQYDPYPLLFFGRFRLQPNASMMFSVTDKNGNHAEVPYLAISFTETDMASSLYMHVTEMLGRYEEFYDRQAWKTYYKTAPGIFITCSTEEVSEFIKNLIRIQVEHEDRIRSGFIPKPDETFTKRVRVTYKQRFASDLETSMEKYDHEKNEWVRVRMPMLKESAEKE